MAIPKALRDTLTALLKDGAKLPDELETCVYFDSDGEFLAAAEKKASKKVGEADARAAKAAKEAREATALEIAKSLGVESADQIEAIRERLDAAAGAVTELDKLKGDHGKVTKENAKLLKKVEELDGFRIGHLKRAALEPHLSRIHADLRDVVIENLLPRLVIGEGDKVTAPEGKAIADHLDEMIKTKPALKAPDYKPGAGTGQGEKKPNGEGSNGKNGETPETPKYTSLGQAISAEAQKLVAAPTPTGP